MQAFGSTFIQATFGIPGSKLHYWDTSGLIKPSVRPAAGRGTKRLYSFRDLIELLVVSRLRESGLSLQRVRRCVEYLQSSVPELEAPLAELTLLTDGETVFLLTDDPHTLMDTLREQMVWSVPIAAWTRSTREIVETAIVPREEKIRVLGRTFTMRLAQDPEDGWWIGTVNGLPGCGSQGRSVAELRNMVADAVKEYLIVRGDISADDQENSQAATI